MAPRLTLPLSMEDDELFPRDLRKLNAPAAHLDAAVVARMAADLDKMWWSRLVIACRGYAASTYSKDDVAQFLVDDAFVHLHKALVESTGGDAARQALADCAALVHAQSQRLDDATCERLFGRDYAAMPADQLKMQADAYRVMLHAFGILQGRLQDRARKTKGVRFEEDTEWQPDDRVVLFEQFFPGNRTWVLMDFDRRVLAYWRPDGARVIFGDRYLQVKKEEGCHLCADCGILEATAGQFASCGLCAQRLCSTECLVAHNAIH